MRKPMWILAALLILALTARLYQINSPSNTFHIARQLNTAMMVRPTFLATQPDTPAWRVEIARLNQPRQLEPPIIQLAALIGYQLVGREDLAPCQRWVGSSAVISCIA
jgi:hypothetical protein